MTACSSAALSSPLPPPLPSALVAAARVSCLAPRAAASTVIWSGAMGGGGGMSAVGRRPRPDGNGGAVACEKTAAVASASC
eukprot:4399341-Prymnesium_polylepis.1